MYQALYRQYRPQRFDSVVGQEHITRTLLSQLAQGTVGHAYLFTGTRGTGKTTCAKLLARAVNCENPDHGNPCNECPSCKNILSGASLDVTEMDAASNTGVDDMRALLDEAMYPPVAMKKRVYIIDEVHMLSTSAFTALLKTLEEPPEHILIILATTELYKVPATILSRCQRYDFRRAPAETIAQNLMAIAQDAGIPLADDGALLLARLGDGSFRDAQSLLERCRASDAETLDKAAVLEVLGIAGESASLRMAETVAACDTAGTLRELEERAREGQDLRAVIEELAAVLRDVLIYQSTHDETLLRTGYDVQRLEALAASVPAQRLAELIQTITDAVSRMQRTGVSRLEVELCLIRLTTLSNTAPAEARPAAVTAAPAAVPVIPEALLARLAALENQVQQGLTAPARPKKAKGGDSPDDDMPLDSLEPPPEEGESAPAAPQAAPEPPPDPANVPKLDPGMEQALVDATKRAMPPIKQSFFEMMEKYFDGKTLTLITDAVCEILMKDANARNIIDHAVRQVFGPNVTLRYSTAAPKVQEPDASGFDAIMDNFQKYAKEE